MRKSEICLLLGVVSLSVCPCRRDAPRRQGIASIFGQAARPHLGTLSCMCGSHTQLGEGNFFFFFLLNPPQTPGTAATTRDLGLLSWGGLENDDDAHLPSPAVWHTEREREKTKSLLSRRFFQGEKDKKKIKYMTPTAVRSMWGPPLTAKTSFKTCSN